LKSRTTRAFRKAFAGLPESVREQAKDAYTLFLADPHHRSLRFKKVHPSEPIWSVRVGIGHRAVGLREDSEIVWFWIGSHADYEKLLDRR
jgi:hypothetical protein